MHNSFSPTLRNKLSIAKLTLSLAAIATAVLVCGCGPRPAADVTETSSVPTQAVQTIPSATGGGSVTSDSDAPGQWGAFNEVLRSGGVFKNTSVKYLKLTFAPLGDSMDSIFTDTPSGNVTVTNATGDRVQGNYSLERDRTLTITIPTGKTKKLVFELSQDGRKLSPISGGQSLTLQP